jgi:N-methylhydantoinase B
VTTDAFTREVIHRALGAVGEEIFAALKRTSMSPIIYETLDCAVGITDARGEILSQGNGVITFLGTLDAAVRHTLDKFEGDIEPGDLFITNDPYAGGGTHLSDVTLVLPVFFEGRLVAFVANKAHWTEVGGMAPGSFTTDSTEVYQEGLQFPLVKLMERGSVNGALIELIRANVRLPDQTLGDLWAGVAANRVGEARVLELFGRYGAGTMLDAMESLLDYGERMVLAELERLPKGTFTARDAIGGDGLGGGPYHVEAAVTVEDDRFTIDFTGTDPQAAGSINTTRTGMESRARGIFRAITAPHLATNGGMFRPLRVVCPDGTLFTARRPAPTSTYWESGGFVIDLVWKALAPHVPDRLPAGSFLSVCATILKTEDPATGELSLLVEPLAGGWGAGSSKDGESGQFCPGNGDTYNIPVEVTERRHRVRVRRYGFHTEDGGAGKHRGGKGVVLDYEIEAESTWLTAIFGRNRFPCWGLAGGQDGSPNRIEIHRKGGEVEHHGSVTRVPLARGDVVRLITGTGGGFGDPRERPRARVAEDLRNGYITERQARRHYGWSS